MKRILFLLFCLIYLNTAAQINFEENLIIDDTHSVNGGPFSVYSTDIDGDGDMDLISASRFDDKIAWYENIDGLGDFGTQQIISVNADLAISVFAEDIDGDGDMDVLSASYADDKIAWYENLDGHGDFGNQQIIATNTVGAYSVHAADLDGDGDKDVLSASYTDNKIAWYENTDGLGNFGVQKIITTSAYETKSVYSADIDGDGDMDVISAFISGIAWYENLDGLGNFSEQIIIENIDGANSVMTIDIDEDGDMDILSCASYFVDFVGNFNKISWLENTNGQGDFVSHLIIDVIEDPVLFQIYSADIDGDNDMDILSAFSDRITWYKNTDGQGNFGGQNLITTNIEVGVTVFASDMDGDSKMDVISGSLYDEKLAWYENIDGQGNFGMQQDIIKRVSDVRNAYAADLDNDGDMDVLSASSSDDKIAWYENTDGHGNFGLQKIISINTSGAWDVYSCDFDGDGDSDVLSASAWDDKIAWYENLDGQGTFDAEQIISTEADGAWNLSVSDIDGDSDLDVISASRNDDKIAWYENLDGQGNFGAQKIITTEAISARAVFSADLDGDGDIDVLSASFNDDKIAWYENIDGIGNFGVQRIITTSTNKATCVYAADIDGDGDIDVLSASSGDNKIAWYENIDGLGNFSTQQIVSTIEIGVNSITVDDMDGDGDLDIVSAAPNFVTWYENTDGQGNFGDKLIIQAPLYGSNSVCTTDINDDGKIDVVSTAAFQTNFTFDKVVWYKNLGILSVDGYNLNDIIIYPNPTTGIVTIKNNIPIIKIELFNNSGTLIFTLSNQNTINLSELNQGFYFIRIKDSDGNISIQKVIKQ